MSERRAVVVGINSYNDPRVVPHLKGAENDAREVFARLQKFGQFDLDREKHLLLGKKAKCDDIRKAISDLFWKKDPCDIAMFYFSGHGFLDDYGNGFIAPWDHEYSNPLVHGIRMQEVRQYFLAENNKTQALLILDCCHSGVSAQSVKEAGATELSGRYFGSLTTSQEAVIGSGKFILASSGADETSREMCAAHRIRVLDKKDDKLEFDDLEKHDHGVMTYYLLEGMDGGAADGDRVKIGKLYSYVRKSINEYRARDDANNDFKVYDSVCSTYEEGPASETVLLTWSGKGKSEVDKLIQQSKNSFNDTFQVPNRDAEHADPKLFPEVVVNPYALLDAITYTDKALSLSPESPEANQLVVEIDGKLQDYHRYVGNWRLSQKRTYMKPPYQKEFLLLEEELNQLCFQALRKLEVEQANLVSILICLALGVEGESSFHSALNIGPFTRARDKAGLANAGVVPGGGSISNARA